MKRYLIVLISFLLISCLSEEKAKYTIGFSQCLTSDSWRKEMQASLERGLSFYPEVKMITKDAQAINQLQIHQIQEFIDQKVDLLIVSPNESAYVTPVIEKAFRAGIPVIVLDRRTTSNKYTAFVGANNILVGRNAGIYAKILLQGYGNILEVGGPPDVTPFFDRNIGFKSVIQENPGLKIIKTIWNAGDSDSLKAFFNTHPEIDLVFTHNDRLAYTVYKVCKELRIKNKVKIIGVDGLSGKNEGLDLVQKGMLDATILYPTGGEEAIQTAVKILKHQPFKKENQLLTTIVNPENVGIMIAQFNKITEQQNNIARQANKIKDLNQIYSSQKNVLYITLLLLTLVLGFGGVLLLVFKEKQMSNKMLAQQNEEIIQQKEEIERVSLQAKEATEDKMRFYSYISHEFKTPLSLILTPTTDLLHRKTLDSRDSRPVLELIQKNANRLLRLVDQLLDLRKIDAGKITLNSSTYDLVSFIADIVNDFKYKAQRSQIDLLFICSFKEIAYTFDASKLDKVLFNLLSNAFNHTPKGGLIHVTLLKNGTTIEILIRDNGRGMTETEKQNAFELFYSGNQNISFGTGLGLALSREFVNLHQGEITLESEKNKGTTFTITLPYSENNSVFEQLPVFNRNIEEQVDEPEIVEEINSDISILIIEDNKDLSTFLKTKLSANYAVKIANTAEEGWELILSGIPDLIISDVMLPGQDGFSLTQKVKEDFRTSHIPVILLTAKGRVESQIEGTKAGADAYMAKPFNQLLLEEQVRNLLENRDRMRRRFSNEVTNFSNIQQSERKFLIDFELLIEKYLKDSTLSVEKISREMGMSRVQLYRKITALTNKNVNDYIAEYKIKKAKQLLADLSKNVTEIAYELGFNNPSYFTTFFKQKTDKTPSEWRQTLM